MKPVYESDIDEKQFARIQPLLESGRKKTKPRKVDLHAVFCAILYLLKTGCQWRNLPKEYPKWSTVYKYFRQWTEKSGSEEEESMLSKILKKISFRYTYF